MSRLNLAALWKLPVIFICENNRFGMGTPIERASSLYELSQKACAYNMARTWVDGMDVLAVRETLKEAVDRARKNSAPTLIEARTYRFMGHSMSDPSHGHYRTKVEVEEQRRHDPIKQFSAALEANGDRRPGISSMKSSRRFATQWKKPWRSRNEVHNRTTRNSTRMFTWIR